MQLHVTGCEFLKLVLTTTAADMPETEYASYDIFTSALEVLYNEVPATVATTGGEYVHGEFALYALGLKQAGHNFCVDRASGAKVG